MELKEIIERGLVSELESFLSEKPEYSNRKIKWVKNQENETDPLHYISDCVFNGVLTNGNESTLAKILIDHGAKVEGSDGVESPLIGAVALSVESVAKTLIEAGANIEATAVHGANSLHWASYVGLPDIVSIILNMGSDIEKKCSEFQATPLFWAVQGFCKSNDIDKSSIVRSAEILVAAGARASA